MRTNIVIDEQLFKQARKLSGLKTKRGIVLAALKEFITNHSRKDFRELKGQIHFRDDYDYKALRA